jgi:acetyl-CoA synthetase
VVAFVIIKASSVDNGTPEEQSAQLRAHVATHIGAIARPAKVYLVSELPKTRSGKIMRRLLRDVAEGRPIGDTTTLTDPAVLSVINTQVH